MKVTNNHDAALNIAGVDARPGATVEVEDEAFASWKTGHAASIWLKNGLVSEGGAKKSKEEKQAPAQTSDEEKAAQEKERVELLEKARELGLNPNANTGTEKLKALIAEKQG